MAREEVLRLPPLLEDPIPSGPATGSWIWTSEDLLRTRALTLMELLDLVPGAVPARGGDHGTPMTVGAFAVGADRIRVFRDGVEVLPLTGGTVDLGREGLAGVGRVRVDRFPGELRIHIESRMPDDLRPFSLIEVGTGDFETNVFRGTFLHPSVGGGILQIGLDRLDTRGPRGAEPGSFTSGGLRYTRPLGDRAALTGELRTGGAAQDSLYAPARISRSESSLSGSFRVTDGIVVGAYGLRAREEGEGMPDGLSAPRRDRSQYGARVDARLGPAWGGLHGHQARGEGWPATTLDLHAGTTVPGIGGVEGMWTRESADGEAASRMRLRGWTQPRAGLSFFGSIDEGRAAAPPNPLLPRLEESPGEEGVFQEVDVPFPPVRFTERSALRAGANVQWRGLNAWGAWLSMDVDSLVPVGLPFDREQGAVGGGSRTGWEAGARIPLLLLDGLALEGWTQQWRVDASTEPWPWLPDRSYEARLAFHDVFFPTGNLEVHFDLGVRGRDGMFVNIPGGEGDGQFAAVPFFQSWSTRLQIRVVTVRIFLVWENVTLRPANQDVPGRSLPQTRAIYGLRWTLWN